VNDCAHRLKLLTSLSDTGIRAICVMPRSSSKTALSKTDIMSSKFAWNVQCHTNEVLVKSS